MADFPHIDTIGHSSHPWPEFLAMLHRSGIETLVDVRSHPYSRFPHFGRERLAAALDGEGLDYLWLGEALGGRPERADLLDAEGRPDYKAMAATPAFRKAVADLAIRVRNGERLVLMCSEGNPERCHRALLIAPALREEGITVRHIPAQEGPEQLDLLD